MDSDKESQYNIWHLFEADEQELYLKKISTFLRGGLWCAELGSFVQFGGDVEGTQPFGIFVSCWHRSEGKPTPKAWEIFGGSGNGFALRAQPSFMQSLANQINADELRVRFEQVRYLGVGEEPKDAAFEVAPTHAHEEEMRLAISFTDNADLNDHKRKEQIRSKIPDVSSNPDALPEFKRMTFVDSEGYEAIILPISPLDLIQEIVIGPTVCESAKAKFIQRLGFEIAVTP
jgi:hypothetical protein